jgi:FkbM family methyltransferase
MKAKFELFKYLEKNIKNELVFDLGANLGQMTKRYVDLGAKVVSVEPQKDLTMHRNFKGVLSIKNVCVSDIIGRRIFYRCIGHEVSSSCLPKWRSHYEEKEWKKFKVETTTLDELIKEFGIPKFIKIDVEGYEDRVLYGLSQKIDIICFEFTRGFMDIAIKAVERLNDLGFKKMMPCIKRKENIKINGKTKRIKLYEIFDEFTDKKDIIDFLNNFKKFQGDMLVLS